MNSNTSSDVRTTSNIIFQLNAVLLCAVSVFFTFFGIFLNCVVIISLLSSQLRRKLSYFMIFILACFDLAVVVVFHPLITVQTICWMGCAGLFEVTQWLLQLFVFSLTALLTMTVERYLALLYPFFHQKFVTRSRLMVVFLIFQLPFCILYFLTLDDTNRYIEQAIPLALIGAVCFVICGMNFKIFYLAKTLRQSVVIPLGSLDGSEHRDVEAKKSKMSLASLGKISTCLLAVVCLFICYCPTIVIIVLDMTKKIDWSHETKYIIYLWSDTFVTLNSSFNCLIFFYKNSALRRHAVKLLGKCFCARSRDLVFYY